MNVFEAILTRRSIRRFKKNSVSKDTVIKLLDAARMAPSGGNVQPWHFTAIFNRSIIKKMENIIKDGIRKLPEYFEGKRDNYKLVSKELAIGYSLTSLFFVQAPVTIAVCVQELKHPMLPYIVKYGMDKYEAASYLGFTEVKSVSAAIQNLLLAAHSLGYGTCWMNIPFFAKDELEKLLKIEKPWSLFALIPIGTPDHSPPTPSRKSIKNISTFLE